METVTSRHNRQDFRFGGPEKMFGMDELTVEGAGCRASMLSGPWSAGPENAAAVGVLADNVLGYALIASAPAGWWSVSTEIALDFFGPLPSDGTRISADGRLVHASPGTGFAEGSVFSAEGETIARCRQWGRFIEADPAQEAEPFAGSCRPVAELADSILAHQRASDGRAWLSLPIEADLVNPLRTLHGGITLWLTELLACHAVGSADMVPASLNVSYLRPLLEGDVATFRAEVVIRGRRLAVTHVTALNGAGKPCIVASAHHHGA